MSVLGSRLLAPVLVFLLLLGTGCEVERVDRAEPGAYDPSTGSRRFTGEVRLRNIRQLTFGGNNAEAYWSFDDERLIFQSDWDAINPQGCDQQFVMNADGSMLDDSTRYALVSSGRGRTTCGYFFPDGRILYASTDESGPECPTPPANEPGVYAWPIHASYNIYVADADGSNRELLIGGDSYDAEATV